MAAARAAADELGRWVVVKSSCCDFGDSTGFDSISVITAALVCGPSLGRSDSVEPLFLSERVLGR
jgi:hypothetical protein